MSCGCSQAGRSRLRSTSQDCATESRTSSTASAAAAGMRVLWMTVASITNPVDIDGWEPILPLPVPLKADDSYDFDVLLQSTDLERFLTPLEKIDLRGNLTGRTSPRRRT
jgi:hypothetical protein